MQTAQKPAIVAGSCWRHHNGFTYIVLAIGNDYPDPDPRSIYYPPTVIYCDRSGKLLTGHVDDWRMESIDADDGLKRAASAACAKILVTLRSGPWR